MATPVPHLARITLNLARSPQYPQGSAAHGYVIAAPLDERQCLDAEAWKKARHLCRVRRFWQGEPDRVGTLVHQAGGPDGATWAIDYDPRDRDDDEAAYRLGSHRFAPGEYVSIRDTEGEMHTFRVARLEP